MSKKAKYDKNIKAKGISRCVDCLAITSFLDKIKDKGYFVSVFNWFLMKQNMLNYCVKCREKTKNLNRKILTTKNNINYAIKMYWV